VRNVNDFYQRWNAWNGIPISVIFRNHLKKHIWLVHQVPRVVTIPFSTLQTKFGNVYYHDCIYNYMDATLQLSPELTGPYINNNYFLYLDWTYTVKKKTRVAQLSLVNPCSCSQRAGILKYYSVQFKSGLDWYHGTRSGVQPVCYQCVCLLTKCFLKACNVSACYQSVC